MSEHDPLCPFKPGVLSFCYCDTIAKARADEREHTAFLHEALLRNQLADLRAKVEALVEYGCPEWEVDPGDGLGRHIRKDRVLALFGGSSDG